MPRKFIVDSAVFFHQFLINEKLTI